MDFAAIFSRARKATTDNSPLILTAIGVAGTITTALLSSRATFKAAEFLHELDLEHDPHFSGYHRESNRLDTRAKAKATWKFYIPPIGSGIATVTCIVMANRISVRRSAALASAYMIVQETLAEYKDKVVARLGVDEEKEMRNEIAEERLKKIPPPRTLIVSGKDCIVHDLYSGLWFTSSYDKIQQAAVDINFQIINEGYATVGDFWRHLGVSYAAMNDEIGWNSDRKLELDISGAVSEDGMPVLTVDFRTVPVRGYNGSY